ncbi:AraC family transcriptional regulator [Anaerosporobacter faecicola]|uniref:AraC family transcriptional regulator n=1 Tax=Anaerosporobacter faecicola TaxID=2718714 RepID=UPI001439CF8F|nr:helix-turn-helix domain-containing protein [Anaerosporobacter faecicola]
MDREWTGSLNRIMDYVEEHLCSEVEEAEVAKIAACPYPIFQSAFSQITGISFAEYVRRRKLTMAAYDLQNSERSIMDVALNYGYQTDDTFRVAFKSMFGVTPSEVRKNNPNLMFYCKLHFKIQIQGIDRMEYQIFERESFEVMGIRKITSTGGGTWGVIKSDGSDDKVQKLLGKRFDLGLCFGFDEEGNDDYMCAISLDHVGISEDKIQECLETIPEVTRYQFPATTWLRFESRGRISEAVLNNTWEKINMEFLPSSKFHKGKLPTVERYIVWDERNDECVVEILIPQ